MSGDTHGDRDSDKDRDTGSNADGDADGGMGSDKGGGARAGLVAAIAEHEATLRILVARRQNPMFDSGLTMQQMRVLVILGADGPLAQGDLAQALGVGLATVTGLVNRLRDRGLVERVADPGDRRIRRARVSPAGAALLSELAESGQEVRHRLLARLDLDALRGLERGLAALRAVMLEDPDVPG